MQSLSTVEGFIQRPNITYSTSGKVFAISHCVCRTYRALDGIDPNAIGINYDRSVASHGMLSRAL